MHGATLRQVARDVLPRASLVAGLEQVRLEIAAIIVVEACVHDIGVVRRGGDVGDVARVRHAGEVVGATPVGAAVLGDLDQSVIGADVEQAFLLRRLGEGDDVAVE